MSTEDPSKHPEIKHPNRISLDRLTLESFPLEHDKTLSFDRKMEIARLIARSNAVFTEFFSPDIDDAFWFFLGRETREYFEWVKGCASDYHKPVYVLDPAHTQAYVTLATLEPAAVLYGTRAGMAGSNLRANRDQNMSRREFLKRIGTGLLATAIMSGISQSVATYERFSGTPMNTYPTMASFRRLVIANGILKIDGDHTVQIGGNIALFYPPTHVKGLEGLLKNPELAKTAYSVISPFASNPAYSDLFSIRKYEYNGSDWERTEIPI